MPAPKLTPHPESAPGDFYVEKGMCLSCGVPHVVAKEQPPIEKRMQIENRKQQDFLDLVVRFRKATDPNEAQLLGNELGRMIFGGYRQ
jgi:hypothetical protein